MGWDFDPEDRGQDTGPLGHTGDAYYYYYYYLLLYYCQRPGALGTHG